MTGSDRYPFKLTPTVVPVSKFNADEDAENLEKAMKGLGTDEQSIIDILTHRGNVQRLEIAEAYKKKFQKDLIEELKKELSGNFESTIVALMTPLPHFYAQELYDAVNADEGTVIEILCTLSNYGIKVVAQYYEQLFNKVLINDFKEKYKNVEFQTLVIELCKAKRDENQGVNTEQAVSDAQAMVDEGESQWAQDNSKFSVIMTTRSYQQLRHTFTEFQNCAGHDIEDAIKGAFTGSLEIGYTTIAKCVKTKVGYLAERLYTSMKGLGTTDKTLIRIVVARCEIDLADIKQAFIDKYGETLTKFITGDTSGDYKKTLLALVGPETGQ